MSKRANASPTQVKSALDAVALVVPLAVLLEAMSLTERAG